MTHTSTRAAHIDISQRREPVEHYNYEHFRTMHLVKDVRRTVEEWGIRPGDLAPDFDLPRVDSGSLRLSSLAGPLLLRFGSIT